MLLIVMIFSSISCRENVLELFQNEHFLPACAQCYHSVNQAYLTFENVFQRYAPRLCTRMRMSD